MSKAGGNVLHRIHVFIAFSFDVLYVSTSEVLCPWKHVCVSVDQLSVQQWMGDCHVMIHAASVGAHLLSIQITLSESLVRMLVQNHT